MLLQTGSEDGKPEPDDAVAVFLLSEADIDLRASAVKQNPERRQFQDRFLQGQAGDHCWKVLLRDLNLSSFVKNARDKRLFPVKRDAPVNTQSISPIGNIQAPITFENPTSKV